jgi:hypothetical protein
MTLPQLVHAVRASLHDHGTRILLLDDITRLRMHRADDQDVLDLIRALMSMHVAEFRALIAGGDPHWPMLSALAAVTDVLDRLAAGRRPRFQAMTS